MPRTSKSSKLSKLPDLSYPTVGYKKPPRHSQFEKGRPGNPNGRPRANETWEAIWAEELARPISVMVDGKKTTVTTLDAIIHVVAERTLAGSLAHALLLMRTEFKEPPRPFIIYFHDENDEYV